MDASVTSAVVAGVGVILTAWIAFMGTKKGTLATAEKDFRSTIMADNEHLRKRIEELETKLNVVQMDNHRMTMAMVDLERNSSPTVQVNIDNTTEAAPPVVT